MARLMSLLQKLGRIISTGKRRIKTLKRINMLIEASAHEPFTGIVKPEPLKCDLTGFWSRRIDDVNRLVYQVTEQELQIVACRYHYG